MVGLLQDGTCLMHHGKGKKKNVEMLSLWSLHTSGLTKLFQSHLSQISMHEASGPPFGDSFGGG